MPSIRLTRREIDRGWLPDVCALTGRPTDERVHRTFATHGGLLFLLPFIKILAIILWAALRKSVRIDLPLVHEKRHHWLWRVLLPLAVMTTSVSVMIGGTVVMRSGQVEGVGGVAVVTGAVLVLATYVFWLIVWEKAVRVTEVSDRYVKLTNVHPAFVEAVEELRDEREERRQAEEEAEYEARRERRRLERENEGAPRRMAVPVPRSPESPSSDDSTPS